jgi:hypothetical protein
VLSKVRRSANTVVCASNLRQLATCMFMYEQDYKGGLIPHWTAAPAWPFLLKPYFSKLPNATPGQTQVRDAILRCPAAYEKATGDDDKSPAISPYQAFYSDYAPDSTTNQNAFRIEGAYGINRYLYDSRPISKYDNNKGFWINNYPKANFFTLQQVSAKRPAPIPLLFDCRWRDAYVDNGTTPYGYYPRDTKGSGQMHFIATRRHDRVVNVAMIDLSVRTAPLSELWSFTWRSDFKPPAPLPKVPW